MKTGQPLPASSQLITKYTYNYYLLQIYEFHLIILTKPARVAMVVQK